MCCYRMFISDGEPWDADDFMAKLSGLIQACPKMQTPGLLSQQMSVAFSTKQPLAQLCLGTEQSRTRSIPKLFLQTLAGPEGGFRVRREQSRINYLIRYLPVDTCLGSACEEKVAGGQNQGTRAVSWSTWYKVLRGPANANQQDAAACVRMRELRKSC